MFCVTVSVYFRIKLLIVSTGSTYVVWQVKLRAKKNKPSALMTLIAVSAIEGDLNECISIYIFINSELFLSEVQQNESKSLNINIKEKLGEWER